MTLIWILSLTFLGAVGIYASVLDIWKGVVRNKVLGWGALAAAVLDAVHYGLLAPNLFWAFCLNVSLMMGIACILFFIHSWAGGDSKLLAVLALLFPAECYLAHFDSQATLPLTVMLAFLLGYGYLVIHWVISLLRKRTSFSLSRTKESFLAFGRSYLLVLLYVTFANMILQAALAPWVEIQSLTWFALDFCLAWFISTVRFLRKKPVWISVLVLDIVGAILLRQFPLSTRGSHYLFLLVVVFLRIAVSQQNYQVIPTAQVQKGMILSSASSLLFLGSRVKGLPGISHEDLRSRLTQEEAESVRRWEHSAHGSPTVTIVRKIPFAVFIFAGFVLYLIIWSVVK